MQNRTKSMVSYNLSRTFRQVVKGKNCMTPFIQGYYGSLDDGLVMEVSWGDGIFSRSRKMWGVTVVYKGRHRYDLSKGGFDSKDEAFNYMNEVRKTIEDERN